MTTLTTHQLAELLLGIARAQQAIVDAVEDSKAGFKSTHFRPMLETAARLRVNRPATLSDYPPRLLLQMLGRGATDVEHVVGELTHLFGGDTDAVPATPAAAPGGPTDTTV